MRAVSAVPERPMPPSSRAAPSVAPPAWPPGPAVAPVDGPADARAPLLDDSTVVTVYAVGPASNVAAATPAAIITRTFLRNRDPSHRPMTASTAPAMTSGRSHAS